MDKIKEDGALLSRTPEFYGKPLIPLDYGVIFPNINRHEYVDKGLSTLIDTGKIFFWDDLHPTSEVRSDPTGKHFLEAVKVMFKIRFAFKMSGEKMNHLKQLIFPVVKIELPERPSKDNFSGQIQRLKVLDHNQEAIARKYDGGHRILTGPSGSGKTLILVHKAAFIKKYNPKINNILFVCYNITLVNYIKRLLAAKNVPLGDNGVRVMHMFQLCSEIIGEKVAYEKEDADYYALIVQEALEKIQDCNLMYDAILVDEGQDISDDMYKIITSLLNKDTDSLTIALDDNQNIYQHKQSWKDMGIKAQGRTHRISYVYRNTKEIADFALKFIGKATKTSEDSEPRQLELYPDYVNFHGPMPEIMQFPNFDEIGSYISVKIKALVEKEGYPFSEIVIIYSTKSPKDYPDIHLPHLIAKGLESSGFLPNWASEDYNSKKSYDITTNSITISTIHGAKGLDYSCVFLLGLDFLDSGRWTKGQIDRLTYVGATRARYHLFIPYINDTPLIKRLQACLK